MISKSDSISIYCKYNNNIIRVSIDYSNVRIQNSNIPAGERANAQERAADRRADNIIERTNILIRSLMHY